MVFAFCHTYLPQRGLPWWKGTSFSDKEFACNAGDTGEMRLIPGSGRSPGGENGNTLQSSCLENPMGRGAWRANSWTQLSNLAHTHTLASKT